MWFVKSQTLLAQTLRFAFAGGIVYLVDLGTFLSLTLSLDVHYLWANAAGKVVGAMTGFFLHKFVTFSWLQRNSTIVQLWTYAALFGGNLLLANWLLYFGVHGLGQPEVAVKVVSDVVVIALSFSLSRYFVFRTCPQEKGGILD